VDNSVTIKDRGKEWSGIVSDVALSINGDAVLTIDSLLARFLTGTTYIPPVESGSIAGAFDLAERLSGIPYFVTELKDARHWSLRGHSSGFDAAGALVTPETDMQVIPQRNAFFPSGTEHVPVQVLSGAIEGENFSSKGASIVAGDTILTNGTEFTICFDMANGTSTDEFIIPLGASYIPYQTGDILIDTAWTAKANPTAIKVRRTGSSTGQLHIDFAYVDALGVDQTITQSSTESAILRWNDPHRLAINVKFPAAGSVLQVSATMKNLTTGLSVSMSLTGPAITAMAGRQFPAFSKRWRITGREKTNLIVGRGTVNQALATTFLATPTQAIAPNAAGSPIAAMTGEVWGYLKQVLTARRYSFTGLAITKPNLFSSVDVLDHAQGSVTHTRTSAGRFIEAVVVLGWGRPAGHLHGQHFPQHPIRAVPSPVAVGALEDHRANRRRRVRRARSRNDWSLLHLRAG